MEEKAFFELMGLLERVHRNLLASLKFELKQSGLQGLNATQAAMLFQMGTDVVTVGDLVSRGYYNGVNAAYNVKKLVEGGYLIRAHPRGDRREARVRITRKGRSLCNQLLRSGRVGTSLETAIGERQFDDLIAILRRLELWLIAGNGSAHRRRGTSATKGEGAPQTRGAVF